MTKAITPGGVAADCKLRLVSATPVLPHSDLSAWTRTVVFAPHPDDESLGCGGVITLLRRCGLTVTVVFVSDGAMSHPGSRRYDRAARVALREAEARVACAKLGLGQDDVAFLRYPDTEVPRHGSPAFGPAAERVGRLLTDLNPTHVLVPWRRDPHCDHRATWELCRAAVAAADPLPQWVEYPIWMWNSDRQDEMPNDDEVIAFRIDVTDVADQKWQAVEAHVSQLTDLIDDDPEGFRLSPAMLANFRRPWEVFFVDAEKRNDSLAADYFNQVYDQHDDPWSFETSTYEHAKYDQTIAALPDRRYASALEIGCSIGVLTERLAPYCDELLAVDVVDPPLRRARRRLAGQPHVAFERRCLPAEFPAANFDLIVLSEVGYYWNEKDLERSVTAIRRALRPGGVLVLVHFTPYVPDYPLTGDEVHEAFAAGLGRRFDRVRSQRAERYRLDVYRRRGGETAG